jgi:hypothetical protein
MRLAILATLAVLVSACAPIGIPEDYRIAFVRIYNRTTSVVSFDGGWVPICAMGSQSGLPPWPSPITSPPPGSVPIAFDLGVPGDYRGLISVVVSETGVQVTRGEVTESDLPDCEGRPPT